MLKKAAPWIIVLLLLAVIGYLLFPKRSSSGPTQITTKRVVDTVKVTDTIKLPGTLVRLPGRIDTVNTTDTIYNVFPFVASADTISSKGDTIGVQYLFPASTFLMDIKYSPLKQDKIYIHTKDTTVIEKFEDPYITWGMRALFFAAGFLLGGR